MRPFQWPQPAGTDSLSTRFFGDGRYFTPDRRARFVSTPFHPLAVAASADFPLVLNTGRIRDQWHTMTRTAKTARLMSHIAEPFMEIHPDDAHTLGLEDASLADVTSPHGRVVVRTLISKRQRPGSVFVPMHWGDQYARAARVCALIGANTDPVSGQPELKAAPISVTRFAAKWYGLAVSRAKPRDITADYWALARAKAGWRVECAGLTAPLDWNAFVRTLFNLENAAGAEILAYQDDRSGQHRFAIFEADQLIGALFVGPQPVSVSRTFAAGSLEETFPGSSDRLRVLAGRAGAAQRDRGAIICSCFEIGLNQIVDAVTGGNCLSVADVGAALKAGTNCGSCRSEIGRIVHEHANANAR